MSSAACTILGTAVLALLLAGYFAQKYLPPPPPKIVGIDLGTTYSCIGVYHAVTGNVDVLEDDEGHKCIPSVVAFSDGEVLVGYSAAARSDHNPTNTLYDAKRFIGKTFSREELETEAARYPFQIKGDERGRAWYVIGPPNNRSLVSPEQVGAHVLHRLQRLAAANLSVPVTKAVMSVPAEFTEEQRNATRAAASLTGIDVLRVINEPTAAALAYGLHKKQGVQFVVVVDLGGGTLDVSLLHIQGGMFLTQAMAGNNHLGGQDFNQRLMEHMLKQVFSEHGQMLSDPEDLQSLRLAAEQLKLRLSTQHTASVTLSLHSLPTQGRPAQFVYKATRDLFEDLNQDLFGKVLKPIDSVLEAAELPRDWVDEVVLVGGSTRIPRVRQLIRDYFNMEPNTAIDPELAVASGVSIQAGILGGMWPLTVSATELPTQARKIQLH